LEKIALPPIPISKNPVIQFRYLADPETTSNTMCQQLPIDKVAVPSMYNMEGVTTVPVRLARGDFYAWLLILHRFPDAAAQRVSNVVRLSG
jgi:hypothetical protein